MLDTMQFLLGSWRIERTVRDHQLGLDGFFHGHASIGQVLLDRDPEPLDRYHEIGALQFGDYVGPASRSLNYTHLHASTVLLRFADMRPFVDLDLSCGAWHSEYLCGNDRYTITTSVKSADIVEERWQVRGTTKTYDALTLLTRVTAAAPAPSGKFR